MGALSREVLATGEHEFPNTITFGIFRQGPVNDALQPIYIELSFNKNVLRQSIQINILNVEAGPPTFFRLGFATAQTGPVIVFQDVRFNRFHDGSGGFLHNFVGLTDPIVANLIKDPNFVWPGQGLTNLGNGFFQDPETLNFKKVITVFRPEGHVFFNSIGQIEHVFFPGRISIEATGFQLSDTSQSSGINEEQVSCLVIDENSKNLYGSRPAVREEQSDFIETQRQACRVAEAILWNRNMVLEKDFTTLFNPGIKRGQTARITNIGNDIDFQGIVKSVGHQFNIDAGSAITEVLVRCTEYVFQSALGEKNPEEKLDQRQT